VTRAVNDGWVGLPEAIEALRRDLAAAWWDGRDHQVRFRVEPVELTVQVGVTRESSGSGGIKWHILAIGGSRKRQTAATQTLKLRLQPVLFDKSGKPLAKKDQVVSSQDDDPYGASHTRTGQPEGEPE
jgi:hypothetical protein